MVAPKLRFQEFDGDWAKSKLGDEAQFFQGEQVSLDDQYSEYSSGLTKFLRIENFTQKSKDFRYIKYSGSPEKILTETDIAIVRYGATAGFICSGETGVIANNLFKASVDNTKINQKYLELVLKSEKTFNYFQTAMSGGAMPALNFKIVGNLDITYSSILEQTKIASFLSAVDEKIAQLSKKLYLLDQYKQGMMQKLFSQQIRFKADDGSEFREWKIGKLGDITSIQGGFAFKSTNFGKGMTKVIRIGDIEKNINLDSFTGIYSNEIPDTRYLISENAIVMALSGATFGKLGKVNQGYAYINQRVATFKVFEDSLNEFVYQIMLSQEFTTYIQSIPSASAQPNISNQDVINFEMMIPCLEEQTKIANFLSAIDQKIDVVSQQIEQAKQWKKGLLQQMFV